MRKKQRCKQTEEGEAEKALNELKAFLSALLCSLQELAL
jgi:hypothetical protein